MGAAVAAAAALFALAAVAGPHQRATATLTSRLPVSLLLRGGNAPRDKDDGGAADVISGGHGIEYQRPAAEGGERHEILAEALSHLEGEGCDLDGNEGDVGLLALNAECGQWVEPGFGLPEGLVDEMIGERFKSGCSVRSDEDDKDDGDKAQGPTATGARETLLASVEAGGTRALAEGGTSSNTGAAECATRGKDAHDGKLEADELKMIQRLEEEAAVMLGVGLKTDWTLLRAALRMIQPNMSAGIKALTHSDIFVDLGCGDGRICIEAALRFNCSAVGVDIDWRCVDEGLNVVGALDLQDKVTLTHGDLLDYNFSAASLVYAFVPAELLAPTSPLYAKLHAFLSGGGMVITCYSVLDYLSPAGVVILDKSRQAFLYTHRSCAKTYVPDPLEEYKAAHAATVVSFGPEGTKEGGDEAWND